VIQAGPSPRALVCLGLAALAGRWATQALAPAAPLLTGPLLISSLLLYGHRPPDALPRAAICYLAALAWPALLHGLGLEPHWSEALLVAGLLALQASRLRHLPALAAGFLAWSAGQVAVPATVLGLLAQALPLCAWLLAKRLPQPASN